MDRKDVGDGRAMQRVFPAPNYQGRYNGPRTDFRETVYWQPSVKTDAAGHAKVKFYLSDAITSFRVTTEGSTASGLLGRGETLVKSKLPVSLAVTMPLEVSAGDLVRLPITVANETDQPYDARVETSFGPAFRARGQLPEKISLRAGERRSFLASLDVVGNGADPDQGKMRVAIRADNLQDEVARTVRVVPLGFPREVALSGTLEHSARHVVDLAGALPGTIEATVTLYPSPLATMMAGTEAIMAEPFGCFEQASSANYPNIMVLRYMEEHQSANAAVASRALGLLDKGYKLLSGYESPKKGYEWFGGDPGHEALTAYGLMEFLDMKKVYGEVDSDMVNRTVHWLLGRRDGKGGFMRNPRALDSFGSASEEVTNGYITFALTEAGVRDLAPEIAYQREMAGRTTDPYVLALAANTLQNSSPGSDAARQALDRLATMQRETGAFTGANHSITRSGGAALDIETTSLAILAMLKAGRVDSEPVRKAVSWLNGQRNARGGYSSTQATVLALKALGAHAAASRRTTSDGSVKLLVNGREIGVLSFEKGHQGALVFNDVAPALTAGDNRIELALESHSTLPYTVGIRFRTRQPASSPEAVIHVAAALDKERVPVGEGVRMKVAVENSSKSGVPMTLARVGIPGGLTFQTWQLKELRDKGTIDFYETKEREVVLYFRSLPPGAKRELDLALLARVPGDYTAPATRAYLYYTDEHKYWIGPQTIHISE
jgi:uncharacterized protein YfaS (alpha-2-macroglobulin family)